MTRYTRAHVDGVARNVAIAAAAAGVDSSAWAIRPGSATYGRAYLLVNVGEHGAQSTVAHLGMTAGEAVWSLDAMRAAFDAVAAAAREVAA